MEEVVEVRLLALDLPGDEVERLGRLLSPAERARAARLRIETARRRFVVARARVRETLAARLGARPAELDLAVSGYGKPFLRGQEGGGGLRFNLSHSRDTALLAVASGREVGVDLEALRPERGHARIAARYFAPGEIAELEAMPAADRAASFFRGWTRKEAVLKALGTGLRIPLREVEVSLGPSPELIATRWNPAERARWIVRDLGPLPGFAAALAVEARGGRFVLDDKSRPKTTAPVA